MTASWKISCIWFLQRLRSSSPICGQSHARRCWKCRNTKIEWDTLWTPMGGSSRRTFLGFLSQTCCCLPLPLLCLWIWSNLQWVESCRPMRLCAKFWSAQSDAFMWIILWGIGGGPTCSIVRKNIWSSRGQWPWFHLFLRRFWLFMLSPRISKFSYCWLRFWARISSALGVCLAQSPKGTLRRTTQTLKFWPAWCGPSF